MLVRFEAMIPSAISAFSAVNCFLGSVEE